MKAINLLVKPASGNCNMNCDYCFYCDEANKRTNYSYGMMDISTLRNVIRRTLLHAEGAYSIAFQGGEPTLSGIGFFEEVIRLIKQYNKNNCAIHIAMQTNGSLIDDKWCRFIKDNNILMGLSVDGTRDINDRYRHISSSNQSAYDRVLAASSLFDKYGVDYNILTVVHRYTALNIREIYKQYRNRNWHYLQFINCLDPLGEIRGQKEYSLTPDVYGKFLLDLFDLWYEDNRNNTAPYIRQFENYIGILLGYIPESCEQRGTCSSNYVIEADGSVFPCDFYAIDEYKLGNLCTDRLADIDERRSKLRFIERSKYLPSKCRECKWLRLCKGGCYRSRFSDSFAADSGNIHGLNYYCDSYQYFFENAIDRLEEIANKLVNRK
ncbi:anaerobic sulfatase maturase [Butyrivibrio sp. MC2013]|uniref:anaerobic sulfatase maturase n=1 Tax=Butyrivibrio sp. MC2013 TaxID=1280686 RepID=UPI0004081D37|nr:anaerobic sulfatase maturase [Butyrivibrio sp. MC2013]